MPASSYVKGKFNLHHLKSLLAIDLSRKTSSYPNNFSFLQTFNKPIVHILH